MNWFKYRLPGCADIICGASLKLEKGFGKGFVLAPFCNPSEGMLTIPFDFVPEESELKPESCFVSQSTPKKDYLNEVETIIRELSGKRGKTVAARTIRLNKSIDINATFDALSQAYPDAFIFAFSSSETGTWIGASPELLLRKVGTAIRTMALAGTRPVNSGGNWDLKNIEEQQLVIDFIKKCLDANCKDVEILPAFTKKAGNVEHICTPMKAEIQSENSDESVKIASLLTTLSPTPAVCGSDREKSLEMLSQLENFPREMYGGFCGPNNIDGKVAFFVTLRVAKCSPDAISVFAGGGILNNSDPETEWTETQMKSTTIINKLKLIEK